MLAQAFLGPFSAHFCLFHRRTNKWKLKSEFKMSSAISYSTCIIFLSYLLFIILNKTRKYIYKLVGQWSSLDRNHN